MKTTMKTMLTACALVLSCAGVAQAQEASSPYGTFSSTLGVYSQYRFRGITQSDENLAVQGSFDWAHDSGLYAGAWASNVDFNDSDEASIETDLYAGYKFNLSNFTFDVGLIAYLYPGADNSLDYDYYEGKLVAGYDFGFAAVSAGINYSPENFGDSGDATYISGGITAPIANTGLTASATIGHQWIEDNAAFAGIPDYMDWSVGLGYKLAGFDLAVRYVDTDLKKAECADGCEAAGVISVSRTF
jgi:uncharacterized protein (TIGR02001 family)